MEDFRGILIFSPFDAYDPYVTSLHKSYTYVKETPIRWRFVVHFFLET